MEVDQQIPERPGRRLAKHVHGVFPGRGKRLQQQVAHPQLISRVLEGDHIMRIARDALGISTGGKHVLTQVDDGDILMMRIFGEQVQNALSPLPSFMRSSMIKRPPWGNH